MAETAFLDTAEGRRIAYHKTEGTGPTVVFLGGLKSDMEGTKAIHLEAWAKARGQAFLRFDYSGHGESSGQFEEGCIGDWHEGHAGCGRGADHGSDCPGGLFHGGVAGAFAGARPA